MEHFPWVFAVWVGAIIIYNIVSVSRKRQRALATKPQGLPSMPVAQSPPQSIPVHEQSFATMPSPEMPQPYAVPAPVVVRAKKPPSKAAHLVPDPDHAFRRAEAPRDGTKPLRGMFDKENLANAFIAAQVFGKPKALQEQSIWSQLHSEP